MQYLPGKDEALRKGMALWELLQSSALEMRDGMGKGSVEGQGLVAMSLLPKRVALFAESVLLLLWQRRKPKVKLWRAGTLLSPALRASSAMPASVHSELPSRSVSTVS